MPTQANQDTFTKYGHMKMYDECDVFHEAVLTTIGCGQLLQCEIRK